MLGDLWVDGVGAKEVASDALDGVGGGEGREGCEGREGATLDLTSPWVAVPSALVAALLPAMAQGGLQMWPQV